MATLALPSGYRPSLTRRRRATSLFLAAGIVALILLMLIRLGVLSLPPRAQTRPMSTFDVVDQPVQGGAAPSPTPHPRQQRQPRHAIAKPPPRTAPPPVPNLPVPNPVVSLPGVIMLTRDQYAATDVSKYHGAPSNAAGSSGDAGQGSGEGGGEGAGTGPHGEKLYAVDWYRRPTEAELNTYMPKNAPDEAWGEVYCRTIARYHVEDCRELDESPAGSGMSRAVRNAAWQFLVRPPRIGGKELIGTWVRIRITLTQLRRGE